MARRTYSYHIDMSENGDVDMAKAVYKMLKSVGAINFKVDVHAPFRCEVWICAVEFPGDRWEVCAGRSLGVAAFRLLEKCIDNGICNHCNRAVSTESNWANPSIEPSNDGLICVYIYDPSTKQFLRGCDN